MQLEIGGTYARPYRPPLYNLRWSAVFAGLVVAVASYLLLFLLGSAAGLAFVNAGVEAGASSLLTAASLWNALSMIAASTAGGYVAARASGMRRTPDGLLHGLLAWGVAMLVYMTLAASAGAALSEMFSAAAQPAVAEVPSISLEERLALVDNFERRLGLTAEQANSLVDQMLALSGQENALAEQRMDARQILRTASTISGWLSSAILLSLLGAVAGGMLGSRGIRRRAPPAEARELDVAQ